MSRCINQCPLCSDSMECASGQICDECAAEIWLEDQQRETEMLKMEARHERS